MISSPPVGGVERSSKWHENDVDRRQRGWCGVVVVTFAVKIIITFHSLATKERIVNDWERMNSLAPLSTICILLKFVGKHGRMSITLVCRGLQAMLKFYWNLLIKFAQLFKLLKYTFLTSKLDITSNPFQPQNNPSDSISSPSTSASKVFVWLK